MREPYLEYDRLITDFSSDPINTREPVKTVLDPVFTTKPVSFDPTIRIAPIDMTGLEDLFTFDLTSEPVVKEPVKTVFEPKPVITKQPVISTVQTAVPAVSKITKSVRILDDQGTPLPGVHVFFDQQTGTVTDFNGVATLSANDAASQVYITHVGFSPVAYAFKDLPVTVQLTSGESLNEVIIDAAKKNSKYLIPAAIGGAALLIFLLTRGKKKEPKKVTL